MRGQNRVGSEWRPIKWQIQAGRSKALDQAGVLVPKRAVGVNWVKKGERDEILWAEKQVKRLGKRLKIKKQYSTCPSTALLGAEVGFWKS